MKKRIIRKEVLRFFSNFQNQYCPLKCSMHKIHKWGKKRVKNEVQGRHHCGNLYFHQHLNKMSANSTTDSSNDVLTQVLHPNDIRILRKHLMVREKGDGTVSKKDQGKKQMTTDELRGKILSPIPEWTLREICITFVAFITGESDTLMRKLHVGCSLYNCHQPLSTYLIFSISGIVCYMYYTCNRYVSL